MNDHPLGDLDEINNGLGETIGTAAKSIVDTILNLDEFLSGDVRRAETTARFCTRPELEAAMEDLNAELDSLTDSQGRPLPVVDEDLAGGGRSALVVASEIKTLQQEYAAAMRSVRMRAMGEDDWTAFQARHKKAIEEGVPYPLEFWEDLIVRSAAAPKFTAETLRDFRSKVGHAVFDEMANKAYRVNTMSGVSIPKSFLSSAVLRQ